MAKVDYAKEFAALLSPHLAAGTSISATDMFASPQLGTASAQTKRKHLKKFLDHDMSYFGTVQGILPSVDSLIDLSAQTLGFLVRPEAVVTKGSAGSPLPSPRFFKE